MVVRKTARVEVRLTPEEKAFLDDVVLGNGESVADWFRCKLDEERKARAHAERMEAVRFLSSLNMEVPEDPADLKREIEEMYLPGGFDL